jgi:hypothetical protein
MNTQTPRRRHTQTLVMTSVILVAAAGCGGGGDDDDDAAARKPDTGYGTGQPVPDPRSCAELCNRLGDCAEALCNEDTHSTRYDGLGELLASQCTATCDESLVDTKLTADQWQCLFQKSCRQAIDYDDCRTGGASYSCG